MSAGHTSELVLMRHGIEVLRFKLSAPRVLLGRRWTRSSSASAPIPEALRKSIGGRAPRFVR
jgi:hypothetical protein